MLLLPRGANELPDLSLDLRNLRCALAAAELGSFRLAAKALELPQSTVSRRIQLLEHRLGFPIFVRSRHGVQLTPAGADFLRDALVGAHQLQRAAQSAVAIHRGDRGLLRVGILGSVATSFLHDLLSRFRKQHPGIHVTFKEGTPHETLRGLSAGEIDVLFVTGTQDMAGYEFKVLSSESIFVVLQPTHRLAQRAEVGWEDIRNEVFIVSQQGCGAEIQNHIICRLAQPGFRPRIDVHDVSSLIWR